MKLLPYFCDCVSILLQTSSQSIFCGGFPQNECLKSLKSILHALPCRWYPKISSKYSYVLQHLFHKFLVPAPLMGEYQHLLQQIKHLVQFLLVVPNNINSYTARRKKHQMSKTCWPTGPSCLNPLAISIRLQNLLLWVKWRGCKSYTSLWDSGKKNQDTEKGFAQYGFHRCLMQSSANFLFVCLYHSMQLIWEETWAASEPVQSTSATVEVRAAEVCFICCDFVRL